MAGRELLLLIYWWDFPMKQWLIMQDVLHWALQYEQFTHWKWCITAVNPDNSPKLWNISLSILAEIPVLQNCISVFDVREIKLWNSRLKSAVPPCSRWLMCCFSVLPRYFQVTLMLSCNQIYVTSLSLSHRNISPLWVSLTDGKVSVVLGYFTKTHKSGHLSLVFFFSLYLSTSLSLSASALIRKYREGTGCILCVYVRNGTRGTAAKVKSKRRNGIRVSLQLRGGCAL